MISSLSITNCIAKGDEILLTAMLNYEEKTISISLTDSDGIIGWNHSFLEELEEGYPFAHMFVNRVIANTINGHSQSFPVDITLE